MMQSDFNGIERRLHELGERLTRLRPLRNLPPNDFLADPYLRDIVERNLEVAAQCCIDISNRIITMERAPKPHDYFDAIMKMGELGVMPVSFSQRFAPIAGFRNILIREYLAVDWNLVFDRLQDIEDIQEFANYVQRWLESRLPK